MDSDITNNNIKNKTRCGICEGVGLVKNINMICDNCGGIKCKFYTGNYHDYAPYKFCLECNSTGYSNPNSISNSNIKNKQLTNQEKKSCNNCYGIGYIKKEKIVCNFCNDEHKMCYCYNFMTPYSECDNCLGSGSLLD